MSYSFDSWRSSDDPDYSYESHEHEYREFSWSPSRGGAPPINCERDRKFEKQGDYFWSGTCWGAFSGFAAASISLGTLATYSDSVAKLLKSSGGELVSISSILLGITAGAFIGEYIGIKLYELEDRWEEKKKQKEKLNQCTIDRKTDESIINHTKPELSIEHFLTGDQKLNEILKADDETVRRLGVTHKQIADRIEYFAKEARTRSMRYLHGSVVDDTYEIRVHPFSHPQKCSLDKGAHEYGDMNVRVRNLKLGEELFFPSLITHSIRDHRYYGGQKLHRVDPKRAVRILDIKPRCVAQKNTGSVGKDTNRIGTSVVERKVDKPTLEKKITIGRSFEARPVYRLKWPRLEEARQRRRHELIKQILADPEMRRWHQTVDEVFWMYGIDL